MDYGIQLYSMRDIAKDGFENCLRRASEIGYKYVEIAGFYDCTPEQVGELLEKYGLIASGTHTKMNELVDNLDKTIEIHKTIGCKNIILPKACYGTREQMNLFIEQVNEIQPKLAAEGITLGYHNHRDEFRVSGTKGDLYVPYLEMLNKTNILFELDIYWAYACWQNPITLIEGFGDRIHFLHLKDGDYSGKGMPLGQGTAPLASVFKKAVELNIPMIVENEIYENPGDVEAEICLNYLKKLELEL